MKFIKEIKNEKKYLSFSVFYFKAIDKEDKHEINGCYLFSFHIPEGSDELEVIR